MAITSLRIGRWDAFLFQLLLHDGEYPQRRDGIFRAWKDGGSIGGGVSFLLRTVSLWAFP